jgi:DNA-binding PadR family transcriptional regulator
MLVPSPLPAHWFQILLALADESRHGLGITKDVFERTGGQMHLWPGMLYGTLKKMIAARLVEDAAAPTDYVSGGGRPRFYRITAIGRRVCAEEAERLARYVAAARQKRLIKGRI